MPEETTLLTAQRFRVVSIEESYPDGKKRKREVVRHHGSVVVLPLLADGRICLIRNFRIAVAKTLIELPAGTLEPGEIPESAASRELIEETGYAPGRLELLCRIYPAPGILDEQMHIYAAHDLQEGDACREPGERIENLLVSWEEAIGMATRGEIEDAKTMVGLLLYHARRSGAGGLK